MTEVMHALVITTCLTSSFGPNLAITSPTVTFKRCETSISQALIFPTFSACDTQVKQSPPPPHNQTLFLYCVPWDAIQKALEPQKGNPA